MGQGKKIHRFHFTPKSPTQICQRSVKLNTEKWSCYTDLCKREDSATITFVLYHFSQLQSCFEKWVHSVEPEENKDENGLHNKLIANYKVNLLLTFVFFSLFHFAGCLNFLPLKVDIKSPIVNAAHLHNDTGSTMKEL